MKFTSTIRSIGKQHKKSEEGEENGEAYHGQVRGI